MVASAACRRHVPVMVRHSPLDDPKTAAHAWARYKRLMRWMFGFTIVVVIVSLSLIYSQTGMVSVHFFIATALGIGFAMLLMSALMGLVFLSSGTGHDESVAEAGEDQSDDRSGDEGRSR